jgi:hypothetical protein
MALPAPGQEAAATEAWGRGMNAPELPARVVVCTGCGDEVEVFGALSLIRHPYKCVQCLDPRHKEKS